MQVQCYGVILWFTTRRPPDLYSTIESAVSKPGRSSERVARLFAHPDASSVATVIIVLVLDARPENNNVSIVTAQTKSR